jgi:hypothetical protein
VFFRTLGKGFAECNTRQIKKRFFLKKTAKYFLNYRNYFSTRKGFAECNTQQIKNRFLKKTAKHFLNYKNYSSTLPITTLPIALSFCNIIF